MKVWVVTAYTPYVGRDLVAIYTRPPTDEEMRVHKREYDYREYLSVDEETTID